MALETRTQATRKNYTGYRSFQYLEPGTDYKEFKLAREIDRAAPLVECPADLDAQQTRDAADLPLERPA